MGTSIKQRIERAQRNRGKVVNIFKEEPKKVYEIKAPLGNDKKTDIEILVKEMKRKGFKHFVVVNQSVEFKEIEFRLIG
jgi:hypothetical protein